MSFAHNYRKGIRNRQGQGMCIGPVKRKISVKNRFSLLSVLTLCSGCSEEAFHGDGCFEYTQHRF